MSLDTDLSLRNEWDKFKEKVVPKDAPKVQQDEMKIAFFGGCWLMLNKMLVISDSLNETEAAVVIERLYKECVDFNVQQAARGQTMQ